MSFLFTPLKDILSISFELANPFIHLEKFLQKKWLILMSWFDSLS